jgi:Flp pilus assembly pilin Flp
MKTSMIKARRVEKGIAATEYLIILLVVAVSAIALFMRYGTTIQQKVTAANTNVVDNVNNTNAGGVDVP